MAAVGVRELKNRLTHYLRRVVRGEEVIVTERGRPIALLQSIQAASPSTSREARLAGLAARGLITLPARRPLRSIRTVKVSGRPMSETIIEDRR